MANPHLNDPEVFMSQCQHCMTLVGGQRRPAPKRRTYCHVCRTDTEHLAVYLDFAAQMLRVQRNRAPRATQPPDQPWLNPPAGYKPGNLAPTLKKRRDACCSCEEMKPIHMEVREGPLCRECWELTEEDAKYADFADLDDHWERPEEGFVDYD